MPTPDGYVINEKTLRLLQKYVYQFARQYINNKGMPPDDKIDHEEMHTTEIHIAKTPIGGIPANATMGSTGEGDTPGVADCLIFQQPTTTTSSIGNLQYPVHNLSSVAIDGEKWILIVRDKYGKWYALETGLESPAPAGQARGPGWVAGLSNEDCLQLTVTAQSGKCSTIPNQTLTLTSPDGDVWTSTTDFIYSGGSGPVEFTRPVGQSMPTLTIDGYDLIWDAAGIDNNGDHYIDFCGGTALCSDVTGTGSGTGGARDACGGNTFTVRLTCTPCLGGIVTCADCGRNLGEDLAFAVTSGSGETIFLTWNGVDAWEGVGALVCGVTLYLRYTEDCELQYSCDNVFFNIATTFILTADCGPPFTASTYIMDIGNSAAYGCNVPACGIITGSISEV